MLTPTQARTPICWPVQANLDGQGLAVPSSSPFRPEDIRTPHCIPWLTLPSCCVVPSGDASRDLSMVSRDGRLRLGLQSALSSAVQRMEKRDRPHGTALQNIQAKLRIQMLSKSNHVEIDSGPVVSFPRQKNSPKQPTRC